MDTFRMEGDTVRFYFKNRDRVDERTLLTRALNVLYDVPEISIGKPIVLPYADHYEGKHGETPFTVVYDIEDGPFIYCEDSRELDELEGLLHQG